MTYMPLTGLYHKVLGVVWSFAWPGRDSYILSLGFLDCVVCLSFRSHSFSDRIKR
jgi:hypothetical protein